MTEYITPIIIAFITAILGPILIEWAKVRFKPKAKKSPIQEAIELNELVDTQLDSIVETIECDRVWIAQFHNGGHFYPTGKSIQKFSFFYEKITPDTSSVQHTFQNIPVSLFPKVFSLLYKEGEIDIPDTQDHNSDCGLFQITGKEYKTKSFYMLAINDLNNNFIGSLTISYYDKKHDITLDEWILLRQKVGAIGTILTDYLHKQ